MATFNLEKEFNHLKSQNLTKMALPAIAIFLINSLADYSLVKRDYLLFLGIRAIFITPYVLYLLFHKKINEKFIDSFVFLIFFGAAAGISVVSYFLGGLSTDYYFGVIVISFAQLAFVPLSLALSVALDLSMSFMFFVLNYLPFKHPDELLIKQIFNYASFSILKFIIVNRSKNLILTALSNIELKRELGEKTHVQKLLGELCHLFNNPLFISMTIIKKLKRSEFKVDKEEVQRSLEKAYEANKRMADVASKMLELYKRKDDDFQRQKDFLYETNEFEENFKDPEIH